MMFDWFGAVYSVRHNCPNADNGFDKGFVLLLVHLSVHVSFSYANISADSLLS